MALDLNALLSAAIETAVRDSVNQHYLEIRQQQAEILSRFALMEQAQQGMAQHTHTLDFDPAVITRRLDSLFTLLGTLIENNDEAVLAAATGDMELRGNFAAQITSLAGKAASVVIDEHTTEYDHDDIVDSNELESKVEDALDSMDLTAVVKDAVDFDDIVRDAMENLDIDDKVRDAVNGMTFNISVE